MFWMVLEWSVVVLSAVFVLSQVVLPPFLGKPFFWMFRKSSRLVDEEAGAVAELQEQLKAKGMKEAGDELRRKLDR